MRQISFIPRYGSIEELIQYSTATSYSKELQMLRTPKQPILMGPLNPTKNKQVEKGAQNPSSMRGGSIELPKKRAAL
jgi:hypothetical protein